MLFFNPQDSQPCRFESYLGHIIYEKKKICGLILFEIFSFDLHTLTTTTHFIGFAWNNGKKSWRIVKSNRNIDGVIWQ